MSNADTPDTPTAKAEIEAHRDDLQKIADSDLPAAWVADELLALVDGDGGDDDT